jgi:hypothetical protein
VVADALHRAGYLERLLDKADRVQPLLKGTVQHAVNMTQGHGTARHAVHVWDRLELSRGPSGETCSRRSVAGRSFFCAPLFGGG